jgi:hypothetical protein
VSDQKEIVAYRDKALTEYEWVFRDNRFRRSDKLRRNFEGAINNAIASDEWATSINDFQNEVCLVADLLKGRQWWEFLEYEPLLADGRSIDFKVTAADREIYIDVKSIHPSRADKWDQFRTATSKDRFPQNCSLVLSKDLGGGEIYHGWATARDRILKHVLSLEDKVRVGDLVADNKFVVLALCSDGSTWFEDDLEDFEEFYRTGQYRPDDSFAKMEDFYLKDRQLSLARSISGFAYMERSSRSIRHEGINWKVRAPEWPTKSGRDEARPVA